METKSYKGMRVDFERLQAYAVQAGWLLLQPKAPHELVRYRLRFAGRVQTLVVYSNKRGFARILLIGLPPELARETNLSFFREIKGAVKAPVRE